MTISRSPSLFRRLNPSPVENAKLENLGRLPHRNSDHRMRPPSGRRGQGLRNFEIIGCKGVEREHGIYELMLCTRLLNPFAAFHLALLSHFHRRWARNSTSIGDLKLESLTNVLSLYAYFCVLFNILHSVRPLLAIALHV